MAKAIARPHRRPVVFVDGLRIGAVGLDRFGQRGIGVYRGILWGSERIRFEWLRLGRIERSQLEWSDLDRTEWLGLGRERLQLEWGRRGRIEFRGLEWIELGGIRE
jgi:hypothetical protein